MKPQQDQNEVWVALQENHFWTSPFVRAGNIYSVLSWEIGSPESLHHVCACLCHVHPCATHFQEQQSVSRSICFFTCSHELKQCNRGYRLQIILGTDCFIHPRNLKGALYSRDAWTFSNQPWMILRISRHSEHENLTQSRLQPQGISRQPFRAQDLWNQLSSRSELMTPDDGWIMLHP